MRSPYLWCTTLAITMLLGVNAAVIGKPQDEQTFAELQQQVAQLQAQLKRKATKQSKSENVTESSERVRDVGRQIVRRNPRLYEQDIDLQIRLYDLSDLFAVSPNYPAVKLDEFESGRQLFAVSPVQQRGGGFGGGGFGGGGRGGGGGFGGGGSGGVFNLAPTQFGAPIQEVQNLNTHSAQVTMQQLVETIEATVKPEMWGESSTSARVKFLGNTLLITATEDMHTQINHLLNLFREHWGKRRTVSVQTWWVRSDHGVTSELVDQDTTKKIGAGVVPEDRWDEFFKAAKEAKNVTYSATLTGHNNQTLHAVSGKKISLTVDADPFEVSDSQWHVPDLDDLADFDLDPDDKDSFTGNLGHLGRQKRIIGFRPVNQFFHDGAAVQVTPLATRGGNFVILDLQAKLNKLVRGERVERIAVEQEGKKAEIELDDIDYLACRFSSTLRCPKDQIVLAGSMTADPTANGETPEILIFVRVSVHTIEEDQSDWKKTTVVNPAAATDARPKSKGSSK